MKVIARSLTLRIVAMVMAMAGLGAGPARADGNQTCSPRGG